MRPDWFFIEFGAKNVENGQLWVEKQFGLYQKLILVNAGNAWNLKREMKGCADFMEAWMKKGENMKQITKKYEESLEEME